MKDTRRVWSIEKTKQGSQGLTQTEAANTEHSCVQQVLSIYFMAVSLVFS